MVSNERTQSIFEALDKTYGHVAPFLNHTSSFQLLIAVILSAQTTDILVNKVTVELFMKYPDAQSMKSASTDELIEIIRRVNYHKTKAKHIKETARMIDEDYSGTIPDRISELIKLPGVGRKVANVIMADIYDVPEGIVVDTHVKRVTYRIGWTAQHDPAKVEIDLMREWPLDRFVNTPKQLILIGRNYCFARNPICPKCPLYNWCEKHIE
jgi:endonuclease III